MNTFILVTFLSLLLGCRTAAPKTELTHTQNIDESFLFGVTVDNIEPIKEIVESLQNLNRKMTTRIAFDREQIPQYYESAVRKISAVSFVMGQLVDSSEMKSISVLDFEKRARDYINAFDTNVDIWEIGNEINGEWLGPSAETKMKINSAFSIVRSLKKKSAITLYYNEACFEKKENEMFSWARNNLSTEMKNNIDYVFISFYEEDCNNIRPDWFPIFSKLREIFPHAKLGFGEVGAKKVELKKETIERYYKLRIPVKGYVGGYFWWYFVNDMVPRSKPEWNTLNDVL